MSGTLMVMVDNVVEVLAVNFVPLQIPGQLSTEMILMDVVEDVVCLGGCTSEHMDIADFITNHQTDFPCCYLCSLGFCCNSIIFNTL